MRFIPNNQPIDGMLFADGTPARGRLIQVANAKGRGVVQLERPCSRCGGAGGSNAWAHTGWTCYQCAGHGHGGVTTKAIYTPEAQAVVAATKAKRDATKAARLAAQQAQQAQAQATAQAMVTQFRAAYPELCAWWATQNNEFIASLKGQLERKGTLSDAQIQAALRAKQQADEKAAKPASAYQGVAGKPLRVVGTTVFSMPLPSAGFYNAPSRDLIVLEDAAGNVYKYTGSSNLIPLTKGAHVDILDTVKAHEEYKGVRQTVIQRPRAPK